MTQEELNDTTPREFFNRYNGHQERHNFEALRDRRNYEALRTHAFLVLSPNFSKDSKLTPVELWKFPWDEAENVSAEADAIAAKIATLKALKEQGRASERMLNWLNENDIEE